MDPDEVGPGRLIYLQLSNIARRICGTGEALWIGGLANERYAGFGSAKMSDAYLAKVDRNGRIIWERTFGAHSLRTIESLASLPSGDVVVAGRDNERTWLARISGDGKIIWEQFVGSGKGASVTTAGDAIFLTAFEVSADSTVKSFSEDVSIWRFDEMGDMRAHNVIRDGINRERGADFGRLFIESANDSVYVLSAWLEFTSAKLVDVTKLDLHGDLVWHKELSETFLNVPKDLNLPAESGLVTWTRAVTTLGHGGPLIALPSKGKIILLHLDPA
jgi:outer membrane protein assembly factor BamB